MYDRVQMEGIEVTSVLRDILAFRYQLIPTMYSLYVSEYWKHGWPVLRVSSVRLSKRANNLIYFYICVP